MRRLLTAGIFGTILGIVNTGTANASIVSSGFLDEKLTEYALSTSLDLKANQSDLTALSNKIGDLPKDIMLYNVETDRVEPVNVKELGVHSYFDIINYLLAGNGLEYNSSVIAPLAVLSQYAFRTNVLDTKIGTLPSGYFPEFPKSENFFSSLRQPLTYPTSLAELITAIYGNSETRVNGLLSAIITGFSLDRDGDGILDSRAGLIPNLDLAKNANDLANANATKIGDLPTEYATVGAALTAIKGIAEDAKAAALAAIPDPKQEGSSGKFVLTVDIVGDNATYRWEKIDREGETTTTTE